MPVTMISAGILGLLLVALALRISIRRRAAGISLGDGGDAELLARVRAHANCAEWVPIGLILLALAERSAGATPIVIALAALLVGARLLHPLGMSRPAPNAPRFLGAVLTYLAVAALALLVIARGFPVCASCGAA